MSEELEARIGRALARWVGAVCQRPRAVSVGMLVATALLLVYAATHLGIHGDTDSLFADDLPFKEAERRYHEAFPTQYENLFVVVDGVTPERAGEAASALAVGLRSHPEHFRAVYLPGGGEFFEQHAFLYLETEQLQDMADRLAEAQPYLAELSRDGTLRGLASMMARGARAVREGDVPPERLRPMFEHFTAALRAEMAGEPHHLSWAELLTERELDQDARRRFLLVQPALAFNELQPAKRSILAVRRIAETLDLTPEHGVTVRITGDVALSYEEMEAVRGQAATAGLASLILVAAILSLALRSARLVLSAVLTLVVGLVWTAAFAALVIGHLNMISVSFAVLFIGLGIDFGIHLCVRYRELLGHGRPHLRALTETARDVGSSLLLCALTTAIGFFAFAFTDFLGVAELGVVSGAGMFISLFCTLTLLPALLTLRPLPSSRVTGGAAWSGSGITRLPMRHPRVVRATALVLGVGAVSLLPEARFDNNPLNVRDPSSEAVRTFNELLERGTSSPWSLNTVAPNLEEAEALAERFRALDVVARVVTLADFIPADQDEKLDIIGDVAMFLAPPAGPDGSVPRPAPAEQVDALRDLEHQADRLADPAVSREMLKSATELRGALRDYLAYLEGRANPNASIGRLESGLLAALPEQLRILSSALGAGRVTLENLPGALIERMVAADGSVRVQIFPAEDLKDHAALEAFVDRAKEVTPLLAGGAVEILESGRTVVRALRQAMITAVIAVALILFFLWRRLDDTVLVLVPLLLAAVLTVATAVLAGIPFNFADVIVLPLLLGIGVDSGIHLVHRARVSRDLHLLGTSTARAVAFSSLTTIASFGSLAFATHLGLATLGRLLTLGVGLTLLCNLVVLPALIQMRSGRRSDAPARSAAA